MIVTKFRMWKNKVSPLLKTDLEERETAQELTTERRSLAQESCFAYFSVPLLCTPFEARKAKMLPIGKREGFIIIFAGVMVKLQRVLINPL